MTREIQNPFLKEEYISRINRVMDYINSNLDKKLDLESICRVANFSPFHFHRIFSTLAGESLNRYIKRRRLEKAANQLVFNPKKTITEIAYHCGFNSSAFFSRAFREHFKMSPGEWRRSALNTIYNDYAAMKNITDSDSSEEKRIKRTADLKYIMPGEGSRIKPLKIEVKDLPDMTVAYIRHIGFNIYTSSILETLFDKLFKWAGPRGLLRFPETKVLMIYHDAPGATEPGKRTISLCIDVPEDTKVDGEIGKKKMAGGKYAVGRFEITDYEFILPWDFMINDWLPGSGYQLDINHFYEIYLNDPKKHPENKWIIDIHIPVKVE